MSVAPSSFFEATLAMPTIGRLLGLAECAHFVHMREVAARRELRNPDEVEALRRRFLDVELRRPRDDATVRHLLARSPLDVRRANLRGEARRVCDHGDAG